MNVRRSIVCAIVAIPGWLAFLTSNACGISGEEIFREDSVGHLAVWDAPEGTMALVRDELRGIAWHHWFSELPNDVMTFGFKADTQEKVQHLVELFAKIEHKWLVIRLEADSPQESTVQPRQRKDVDYRIVFWLGNQKLVDQWHAQELVALATRGSLKELAKTNSPPQATPPTMNIYVGDGEIDLDRLDIPLRVDVVAGVYDNHRKDPAKAKIVEAIDFVSKRHQLKQAKLNP